MELRITKDQIVNIVDKWFDAYVYLHDIYSKIVETEEAMEKGLGIELCFDYIEWPDGNYFLIKLCLNSKGLYFGGTKINVDSKEVFDYLSARVLDYHMKNKDYSEINNEDFMKGNIYTEYFDESKKTKKSWCQAEYMAKDNVPLYEDLIKPFKDKLINNSMEEYITSLKQQIPEQMVIRDYDYDAIEKARIVSTDYDYIMKYLREALEYDKERTAEYNREKATSHNR